MFARCCGLEFREALIGTVLIARQEEEIHEPTRRRAT